MGFPPRASQSHFLAFMLEKQFLAMLFARKRGVSKTAIVERGVCAGLRCQTRHGINNCWRSTLLEIDESRWESLIYHMLHRLARGPTQAAAAPATKAKALFLRQMGGMYLASATRRRVSAADVILSETLSGVHMRCRDRSASDNNAERLTGRGNRTKGDNEVFQ